VVFFAGALLVNVVIIGTLLPVVFFAGALLDVGALGRVTHKHNEMLIIVAEKIIKVFIFFMKIFYFFRKV